MDNCLTFLSFHQIWLVSYLANSACPCLNDLGIGGRAVPAVYVHEGGPSTRVTRPPSQECLFMRDWEAHHHHHHHHHQQQQQQQQKYQQQQNINNNKISTTTKYQQQQNINNNKISTTTKYQQQQNINNNNNNNNNNKKYQQRPKKQPQPQSQAPRSSLHHLHSFAICSSLLYLRFTSHFLAAQARKKNSVTSSPPLVQCTGEAMAKVMSFIFWASSFSELSDPNHHIKASSES